jgi:prepilin-type N-terminal cleavage/methylation domain-containing protein
MAQLKGFTIIESIVALLLASIAATVLFYTFRTVERGAARGFEERSVLNKLRHDIDHGIPISDEMEGLDISVSYEDTGINEFIRIERIELTRSNGSYKEYIRIVNK